MSIHAGRSKYYKGKISRVRADGTFDVAYDDGEAETRVEERLIRSLDGGGRGSRSPSPRGGRRGRLREGDKIEARYRGRSRYYPGRIARDRNDGTYDVDYDDGEKETHVLEEYIKQTDNSPRDSRSPRGRRGSRLSEGDAIEARYRGRSKYYKGRIRRDRGDGTFDIDYDDGEQETRVLEEHIRPRGGGREVSVPKFRRGERIEARYRGRAKYYRGRIARERGDSLYDIDYEDGESETRVAAHLIRSLESGASGISSLD